jgi:hypothetical protein
MYTSLVWHAKSGYLGSQTSKFLLQVLPTNSSQEVQKKELPIGFGYYVRIIG